MSQETIDIDIELDDNTVQDVLSSDENKNDQDYEDEAEPTTPVPSSSATEIAEFSKETRKLRKKKVFFGSDDENRPTNTAATKAKSESPMPTKSKPNEKISSLEVVREQEQQSEVIADSKTTYTELVFQNDGITTGFTDVQIDSLDTDDLMEEVDRLPLLRKSLVNKKKTKRLSNSRKLSMAKSDLIQKYFHKKQIEPYDPEVVKQLAQDYPDKYWRFHANNSENMIDYINSDNPVKALPVDISDAGAITGMTLSDDGTLLVTFCNIGAIKIWDIRNGFHCLRHIRDRSETQIDEFYCGQILPKGSLLVTGGKLKNRHRWSAEDNDNHIMPCPIKIFDLVTGDRVAQLDGHTEEILCIKAVVFKGQNYLISTSQDGYIIKWHMNQDWTTLLESTPMIDGVTCMAFTVSFVPNTGNKYFMAACDEHLRLYDFEQATLIQTFEDMYSSYCDCGKFVDWVDEKSDPVEDIEKQVDDLAVSDTMQIDKSVTQYAWFISRGAEMCDVSDGVSSKPNTCTLHKLVYPDKIGGKFELQTVKKYTNEDYHANSWLVKITSNGRYILAPTIYGQIFVFNMASGQISAVIKEHEDIEVRDVIFHPYMPFIFSCSDDGFVKVYTYIYEEDQD